MGISTNEVEDIIEAIPNGRVKMKTKTIARIFKKDRAENFISDWFAFLMENNLDVLESLFTCAGVTIENLDFVIEREYIFQDGRRIDFLLNSEDTIVGIENKIDAVKLENQLRDYSQSLDKLAEDKDVVKIFLKPESNLSEASHGFISVTYEELILELKKIHINFIEDLRGAFLLNDFITHVEENITLEKIDKYEFNDWTTFLSKYSKKLLEVAEDTKEESKRVNSFIRDRLRSTVNGSDEWILGNDKDEPKYIQLYKKSWTNPFVHFELYRKDSNLLPSEFDIRLDIELGIKETRDKVAEKIHLSSGTNIIEKNMKIDYTTPETFNFSVDKIMSIIIQLVEEYEFKIDDALETCVNNETK